ncbi:hypothetical protein H4219_000360 [Mycoemilia scoparia]|uniref:VWFA domain-containing protein n=1 Tax=Mycoemilia scoparia TaxID=417184 RepID=A0A9W8DRR9_9FUNG|nr:hypothetical protein H4219_000360 [Mycoemilia scoparia]
MLLIFLVDTSVSMAEPLEENAASRLDCAKGIVEQIVQRRAHSNDRFMLFSYNEHQSLKSGLRDSPERLLSELKELEATDLFHGDHALAAIFEQLQLLRMVYDTDTFGFGRYPMLGEPTSVIWITDGGPMVDNNALLDKLNIPYTPSVRSALVNEPFRWDQRLFTIFLHKEKDSDLCSGGIQSSERYLIPMCHVMGGSVHHISAMKMGWKLVEKLAPSKAFAGHGPGLLSWHGVMVNFEPLDTDPSERVKGDSRVLILSGSANISSSQPIHPEARKTPAASAIDSGYAGYFPIPETFWPQSLQMDNRPLRAAHPTIGYVQKHIDCDFGKNFPFDKFQIDSSCNVSRRLLEASAGQIINWPIFITKSYKAQSPKFPFGILRANSARTAVNLYILPYNFPVLFNLLKKLPSSRDHTLGPNDAWRREFHQYLEHIPAYYAPPLRRVFSLAGLPVDAIPPQFGADPAFMNLVRYCASVRQGTLKEWAASPANNPTPLKHKPISSTASMLGLNGGGFPNTLTNNAFNVSRSQTMDVLNSLRHAFISDFMATRKFQFSTNPYAFMAQSQAVPGPPSMPAGQFSNGPSISPDIARSLMFDDQDSIHSIPVGEMGKYQTYIARQQAITPRDPTMSEEDLRQIQKTMFGNPYKRFERSGHTKQGNLSGNNSPGGSSLDENEIEIEAELNEVVMDDMDVEDILGTGHHEKNNEEHSLQHSKSDDDFSETLGSLPDSNSKKNERMKSSPVPQSKFSAFGYTPRKAIPRLRSIKGSWKNGDASWNINPWAQYDESELKKYTKSSPKPQNSITPQLPQVNRKQIPLSQPLRPALQNPAAPHKIHAPVPNPPPVGGRGTPSPSSSAYISPLSSTLAASSATPSHIGQRPRPESQNQSSSAHIISTSQATITIPGVIANSKIQSPSPPVGLRAGRTIGATELKDILISQIKADNSKYDEEALKMHLKYLDKNNTEISLRHKQVITDRALLIAKSMKRKTLIPILEKIKKSYQGNKN